MGAPAIYVALLHFPVLDRRGEVVATAVTNVDLHDVVRSARTYGIRGVFFVTPVSEQQRLVRDIVRHWTRGRGSQRNPLRAEPFRLASVVPTLDDAVDAVFLRHGAAPVVALTSARFRREALPCEALRARLREGPWTRPLLLVFGTGWGVAPSIVERADLRLRSIEAAAWAVSEDSDAFNHLSVRSAIAVVLDRLLGNRPDIDQRGEA